MNARARAMTFVTAFVPCLLTSASAAPPDEPLDPEKAFPATAQVRAGGLEVRFRIRDGYYLYRDRFSVETVPGIELSPPELPAGIAKDDPFVGPATILLGSAEVRWPFARPAGSGTYRVKVTAQGCAAERVCYAPFTQTLRVRIP